MSADINRELMVYVGERFMRRFSASMSLVAAFLSLGWFLGGDFSFVCGGLLFIAFVDLISFLSACIKIPRYSYGKTESEFYLMYQFMYDKCNGSFQFYGESGGAAETLATLVERLMLRFYDHQQRIYFLA